jgi:hypothetical protein
MIENMALLKQAMEQMDAEDPDLAQTGKERAAGTLSDAGLSFLKLAELMEQRRLLLRPRIMANIKRMDQPGMLGEAAFRDAGSALRREGQSFRQIAEALELNTPPAPRYEDVEQESEPPQYDPAIEPSQYDPAIEPPRYDPAIEPPRYDPAIEPTWYDAAIEPSAPTPGAPRWMRALLFVASLVFFPLRHPIRFLAIAPVVVLLFYASRGFVPLDRIAAVVDSTYQAMVSVSAFVNEQIVRRSKEVPAPPTASASIPSPATSLSPSRPSAPSAAAALSPPVSTPRRDARGAAASNSEASSRRYVPNEDDRLRAFDDIIPEQMRRKSRMGGACVGGVGGCYWGGLHY